MSSQVLIANEVLDAKMLAANEIRDVKDDNGSSDGLKCIKPKTRRLEG